jgi:hypothetical protein
MGVGYVVKYVVLVWYDQNVDELQKEVCTSNSTGFSCSAEALSGNVVIGAG